MTTDDRLKGIATFVQVVETGGFAAAALRTRQTRSAVAKTVARLERRLGARLFHRTTRKHAITEAGQAYYEHCKRALQELDAAEAAIEEGRSELVGRLRVAAPLLLGRHIVGPVLCGLVRRHPRLQLDMSLGDRMVDLDSEGFDLAVRAGPLRDSTSLNARHLGTHDWVLCASPAYITQHGVPKKAQDFAQHTAIVYAGAGLESEWTAEDADGLRELPIQRRIRADDVDLIMNTALAGLGIARLPRWLVAGALDDGHLQVLWEKAHRHVTDVTAVWPRTPRLAMKTRAAVDLLVDALPAALLNPRGRRPPAARSPH